MCVARVGDRTFFQRRCGCFGFSRDDGPAANGLGHLTNFIGWPSKGRRPTRTPPEIAWVCRLTTEVNGDFFWLAV